MEFEPYFPPFYLKNGHCNTMYPTVFRKQKPLSFQRKRLITKDQDFLDIDYLKNNHKRVAILCHGLEGSSSSKYIVGLAGLLHENQWDVAAINYRSCSGEINLQKRVYHSGATDDLDEAIQSIEGEYDEITLIGFSLGGNLSLVYGGQQGQYINTKIKSIVGISVPTDLSSSSKNISRKSNFIYQKKFLLTLLEKVRLKSSQFPEVYNEINAKKVKTLFDFDDVFTGPLHGFEDAEDYYKQCSSKQFIPKIKTPTLIINALDDPFLTKSCFPYKEVKENPNVELITPKYGGHVGFVQTNKPYYWSEKTILNYINSKSSTKV